MGPARFELEVIAAWREALERAGIAPGPFVGMIETFDARYAGLIADLEELEDGRD